MDVFESTAHESAIMNRQYRQQEWTRNRFARHGLSLCALLGVSCLPTDNLSEYSKGGLLTEPDDGSLNAASSDELPADTAGAGAAGEGVAGDGVAADGVLADGAPALSTGTVDSTSRQAPAGQASAPPTSSRDLDAGPVPALQPGADSGALAADAGAVASCARGATASPDQRCFALVTTPSSWQDARTACQAKGTGWDLTTIHNAARNSFLASFLGTLTDAWVGASDAQSEGVWRWLGDGGAFWNGNGTSGGAVGGAFVSWTAGTNPEPNGGDLSDCLRLRAGGGWADLQCTTLFAAICEGPPL
jgi:hypothetical protein